VIILQKSPAASTDQRVSVVLPAYNEAKRLENAVRKVEEYLKKLGYDYEIIIAEDGSTDGTDEIARRLARDNPRIRHIHSDERLGRGRALTRAFKEAKGNIVVYMDVDLSTDLEHLKELINAILDSYDVATGSRLVEGSKTKRPLKRDIASRGYNFLVRLLLRSKIHDHQCGFKAFRKDAILKISEKVRDTHWFWDTETLVVAQRLGYSVKEIPVRWVHGGDTKVRFGKDVLYMFSQIIRMFLEDIARSRKFYAFATLLAIVLLTLLTLTTGLSNFLATLFLINPEFLISASIIYFLSFIIRGYRFHYLMKRIGENSSLKKAILAVNIGQTVNVITPVRLGDLARAYVFKKYGIPYTASLGGIAAERSFDILSIGLIALFFSIYLGTRNVETYYAIAFAILMLFLILFLSRMKNLLGKIMQKARIILSPASSISVFLLSILIWLCDIIVCYLISASFGISIALVALAVAIGNIVKAIPITPGGIGTYELAVTAVISLQNPSSAFAIAFADHSLKNLATIVLGFFSLSATNLTLKEVKS